MMAAALALLIGVAAPAAQAGGPSPAQQMQALSQALSSHGMSPAGVAKVKTALQTAAGRVPALGQRVQQATIAAHQAAVANPFNPAAFDAAMRARKAAVLAIATAQEDANIGLYESLTPGDKKAFALTVAGGGAPAGR